MDWKTWTVRHCPFCNRNQREATFAIVNSTANISYANVPRCDGAGGVSLVGNLVVAVLKLRKKICQKCMTT